MCVLKKRIDGYGVPISTLVYNKNNPIENLHIRLLTLVYNKNNPVENLNIIK